MNLPPSGDRTFQQAWQDLHKRLTKTLSAEIDKRLGRIMGNTMEDLTRDIEDPALRERTTEALLLVKLLSILAAWQQQGLLSRAEYDELEQLVYRTAVWGQTATPGHSANNG